MPLSFAVEGGAVGALLVLALTAAVLSALRPFGALHPAAFAAVLLVSVFGFFGQVSESIPVSVMMFVVIGASISGRVREATKGRE